MPDSDLNENNPGAAKRSTECSPAGRRKFPGFCYPGNPVLHQGRTAVACILIFALTALVFLPSLRNGFLNFDDGCFVTGNADIQRGLTWSNLAWAFLHPVAGNWHPVTTLSHMFDCQFYGLKPWGHHLTNVLLHAVNAVLLFLVFQRMTGACWRSVILAMFFALHPLRVESVAWVAERKDVLSTLFWLLTMWAYVRFAEASESEAGSRKQKAGMPSSPSVLARHPSPVAVARSVDASRFYLLALLFFTLGLMSKPMLVTLPFALLLLDYWPLKRFGLATPARARVLLPLVWEKLPFFGLALACSAATCLVQSAIGAVATDLPLGLRLANTPISYVRYIGKALWPADLAVFYPHPFWWPAWQVAASIALLLIILGVAIRLARRQPYLIVGWLWFCGTLVPVIGLVQVGNQSIADRYTYVPLIGLLLMLVWAAHDLMVRWRYRMIAQPALVGVGAVFCIALTNRQVSCWKDDESLWGHAVSVTKSNAFAHLKLGAALASDGRIDEAIGHFETAAQLSPRDDRAYSSLARALVQKRRVAEAVQLYETALRLNPDDAGLHNDLGLTLARQGRGEEAVAQYAEALRLKPDFAEVRYNLGLTLASQGAYQAAAEQFQEVLRLNPENAVARQKLERALAAQTKLEADMVPYREGVKATPSDARSHSELGRKLLEAGHVAEAAEQYAEAARLEPKSAEAQYQLGAVLARQGDPEKAARQFELALELNPAFAAAHYALGILDRQKGRIAEALRHWREAARLQPQWPDPLNNLAWSLATDTHAEFRDGPEAVILAQRAVELVGTNNVGVMDTLAAAYAEAGRFADATVAAQQAQVQAEAQNQPGLAAQIGQRLALYRARRPYRAPD